MVRERRHAFWLSQIALVSLTLFAFCHVSAAPICSNALTTDSQLKQPGEPAKSISAQRINLIPPEGGISPAHSGKFQENAASSTNSSNQASSEYTPAADISSTGNAKGSPTGSSTGNSSSNSSGNSSSNSSSNSSASSTGNSPGHPSASTQKAAEEAMTPENKAISPGFSSLQLFLPSVLEKSKPVWGSLYDSSGAPLSETKVMLNGQAYESDEFGLLSFMCPDAETLTITVLDDRGTRVWEAKYFSTQRGLLISDKTAEAMIDSLDELASHCGNEPIISHAPSVVEPLQAFTVIGKNFSGKQGDNDVEIDDANADLLAASPRSLVAVSGRFMRPGAIKELKVASKNLTAPVSEIDVCRPDVKFIDENGKTRLRINVIGSTLPVAVSVINQALKANLRFGGWRLGRQNIFLSPGGVRNLFEIEADPSLKADTPAAHIISNGIFDPYSLRTTRNLITGQVADLEEKAETIRLKKREIVLEAQRAQVSQERQTLLKAGKLTADEDSRLETSEKSLASRLFRIEKMMQSRRAVLESEGSGDYPRLLEAAANNSLGSLEALAAGKEIGFTEARLLRVTGRKAEEQAQGSSLVYAPLYKNTPAVFLQKYRKKYGKKGLIPPPPQTAILLPPPPPYRPGADDLGPLLNQPVPPHKSKKGDDKIRKKDRTKNGRTARDPNFRP